MYQGASIFSKCIKVFLVLSIMAALSGGAWFYRDQKQSIRKRIEEDLSAIARLKADQIAAWRKDQLEDAAAMQMHPFLPKNVLRFMAQEAEENERNLLLRFRSLADQHDYDDIILLSPDGSPLLSLIQPVERHDGYLPALATAIRENRPVFTNLHRAGPGASPHISVVVPVHDDEGQLHAALVLVCDANRFLYPLVQFWPTPRKTAETLLVKREGDNVLFLNNLRHQPDTALNLRIPLSRTKVPAVMAVLGKEGLIQGEDYRGVEVISVILPVPDSPWFMVAKIDEMEAFAEWHFRSLLILALLFGLAACIVAAGLVLWQRDKKLQYRALYLSEAALRANVERHSVTLRAIGDAVISTDSQGTVEFLNPPAEELTGWKQEEARGRSLGEVFRIIDEETREPLEDPVAKVLREGVIVGLANHTILISREGTERPIADSGAPIRDEADEITGVVLVFRDQSAEHEAREALRRSEARYRTLFEASADGILIVDTETNSFRYANPAICRFLGYSGAEFTTMSMADLHPETDLPRVMADFESQLKEIKTLAQEIPCRRKDGSIVFADVNAAPITLDGRACLVGFFRDISARKQAETEREKLQDQLIQAQKMEAVGRLAGGVAHDYNNILSVIIGYSELAMDKVRAEDPLREDLKEIYDAANRSRDITRQLLAFARKEVVTPETLDLNASVESMLKILRKLIGEDIDLAWQPGKVLWPVLMDPSQLDQILANLCVNARDAIADVGKIIIETGMAIIDADYCSGHVGFIPGDFVLLAVSDDGCGMDRETMENIFEPFFTTKGVGKGTGLGLSTVYGIVKQNNGFINVYSEPACGTTFRIYLPGQSDDISGKPKIIDERVPNGNGETVLVVEDEISILKLAEGILSRCNYKVLLAKSPSEAFRLAEVHCRELSLLITDVVMPEMNGRELADQLKKLCPGIKCLFMSGYTADVIAHRGVLDEGIQFIQKPFSTKGLAAKVREALEK
jgi:two-component system, cell cycle sensor histidine kinase and response regulator CckA